MEYLTIDNFQTAFIIVGYVIFAIRQISKWTSTTKDDVFIQKLDAAFAWVEEFAPMAYQAVERLAVNNQIPKAQKAFTYLKMVKEAYEKAHAQPMPKIVSTTANIIAQGQAAIDKAKLIKDHVEAKINGTISPYDEAQP